MPKNGYEQVGQSAAGGNDSRFAGNDLDQFTRPGFIRKVYAIISTMLLLTVGIMVPFCLNPDAGTVGDDIGPTLRRLAENPAFLWPVVIGSFVIIIAICCCRRAMHQVPLNYILLFLFATCQGIMLGVIAGAYEPQSVLLAGALTCGITIGLTLFACQSTVDFTGAGPYLFAALLCLVLFGFFSWFIPGDITRKIYAGCGALIFSMYLVYDTQLIIGYSPLGNAHKHKHSVDDYVLAALDVYLDIINLFVFLLQLLGDRK